MLIFTLFLLFLVASARGGGTNCSLQCNAPHCLSVCEPACLAPACIILCDDGDKRRFAETGKVCRHGDMTSSSSSQRCLSPSPFCAPANCRTECAAIATDEEVNTMCPVCEIHCESAVCTSEAGGQCQPVCQQPECGWKCRKPRDDECPPLICERQCEVPACEYSSGNVAVIGLSLFWLVAATMLL